MRMQFLRKRNGTKEELEKQRKSYALNPEIRQKKKEHYEEDKKNQKILQLEKEKKRQKEEAEKMVVHFEGQYRKNNDVKYKGFQWIVDFLQHFYETFKFVCKVTKNKLIELMDNIEEH